MRVDCDAMNFFFNDTATTEIYTLSLHDALPISPRRRARSSASDAGRSPTGRRPDDLLDGVRRRPRLDAELPQRTVVEDRKSTRLNSSHANISYAVFCLKKKKKE